MLIEALRSFTFAREKTLRNGRDADPHLFDFDFPEVMVFGADDSQNDDMMTGDHERM